MFLFMVLYNVDSIRNTHVSAHILSGETDHDWEQSRRNVATKQLFKCSLLASLILVSLTRFAFVASPLLITAR